jgi:D-alanyl-D-alanine carboxypeptidase
MSWAIYDGKKCIPLWSKAVDMQCEIASLTKIMTAYLVCLQISEHNINPKEVFLRVSKRATFIGGTSACLKEGQRLSIYDLLVGLMLPSGNDAAIVLAEHFGRLLLLEENRINLQLFKQAIELDPFDQ